MSAPWTPADGLRLRAPIPVTVAWILALLLTHGVTALGPAGIVAARTTRQRIAAGGQFAPLIDHGAIWRFWTSTFVHVDLVHLLSNASAIWVLGRVLEPMLGGWRFSAWLFTGAVAGSLLAHLAGHLQSDGASGGAFALLGAAVVLGWCLRRELPPDDARLLGPVMAMFLALNLVLSVVLPFVDLVGHLGGLGAGTALAIGVGIRSSRLLRTTEVAWVLASIATCAYGFARIAM